MSENVAEVQCRIDRGDLASACFGWSSDLVAGRPDHLLGTGSRLVLQRVRDNHAPIRSSSWCSFRGKGHPTLCVLTLIHCNGMQTSPNAKARADRHFPLILERFRRRLNLLVVVFENLGHVGPSCPG